MPRVRLAPGVSSISERVMSVVGVAESVVMVALSVAFTRMVWLEPATSRAMCRTGFVPDATVTGSVNVANPVEATSSWYTPSGASGRSNSPVLSVSEWRENCELIAFSRTWAPATGRCCGSCTTPWTVAKTVACAERDEAARNAVMNQEEGRIRTSDLRGDRKEEKTSAGKKFVSRAAFVAFTATGSMVPALSFYCYARQLEL